jgi:hypothetical protein
MRRTTHSRVHPARILDPPEAYRRDSEHCEDAFLHRLGRDRIRNGKHVRPRFRGDARIRSVRADQPQRVVRLSIRESFLCLRIPVTFHRDLRRCVVDMLKIIAGEFDRRRGDVFVEAVEFGGAGDWDDPGLLRE